jgi:site-specific DNA recombinase
LGKKRPLSRKLREKVLACFGKRITQGLSNVDIVNRLRPNSFGVESQLVLMQAFAKRQEFAVVAELVDTYTGVSINRPKLAQLRTMIRNGEIEGVVFFSSDRFTREMADGQLLRSEIFKYGVRFFYASSGREVHDTPEDELNEDISAAANKYWWNKIKEAVVRTRKQKIDEGYPPGTGTPLYGYKLVGEKRRTSYETVPALAAIVQLIFHMFVYDNMGVMAIVKYLSARKVPSPGDISRTSKKQQAFGQWHRYAVYAMLRNESYIGKAHVGKFRVIRGEDNEKVAVMQDKSDWIEISVPAIIDEKTFDLAQAKLDEGRKRSPRGQKYQYLMGRLMTCKNCGLSIQHSAKIVTKNRDRVIQYYRCPSIDSVKGKCGLPYFHQAAVDCEVEAFVRDLLHNRQALIKGLEDAREQAKKDNQHIYDEIALIGEKLAKNDERMQNLLDAIEQKTMAPEIIRQRYNQLKGASADLSRRKSTLEGQIKRFVLDQHTIDSLDRFAEKVRQGVIKLDDNGMRDTIEALHITGELAFEDDQKILYLHWWYQTFVIHLDGSDDTAQGADGSGGNDGDTPLSTKSGSTSA